MEAGERYVGVDVSASELVVGVMPTGEIWEVANDTEGIASLRKCAEAVGATRIVLEATGGYETGVAAELFDAGLPVSVVNPRQVREFARATGRLAKTDATMRWSWPGSLKP